AESPRGAKRSGRKYGKRWKRADGPDGRHPPATELCLRNRHFAWTDERLADAPDELRPIDRDTLLWLITKAGPAFSAATSGTDAAADTEPVDLLARIEAATGRWPSLKRRWQGDWTGLKDQ